MWARSHQVGSGSLPVIQTQIGFKKCDMFRYVALLYRISVNLEILFEIFLCLDMWLSWWNNDIHSAIEFGSESSCFVISIADGFMIFLGLILCYISLCTSHMASYVPERKLNYNTILSLLPVETWLFSFFPVIVTLSSNRYCQER